MPGSAIEEAALDRLPADAQGNPNPMSKFERDLREKVDEIKAAESRALERKLQASYNAGYAAGRDSMAVELDEAYDDGWDDGYDYATDAEVR